MAGECSGKIQRINQFNKTVMNNNFYSVVYVSPSIVTDEKISMGLFVCVNNKCYFKYDKKKIKNLSNFYDISDSFIVDILENINENVMCKSGSDDDLFNQNINIKKDYFNYLSRYCNNLIKFSHPNLIKFSKFDDNVFEKMFKKFVVFNHVDKKKKVPSYKTIQKNKFRDRIISHVDIDYNATTDHFKNLIVPTKLDFIGKNSIYVSGDFVDFNMSVQSLKNTISRYVNFNSAIENGDITSFIIGKEPEKSVKTNHDIWSAIRKNRRFKFVDENDFEEVEFYFSKHDVKPLSRVE